MEHYTLQEAQDAFESLDIGKASNEHGEMRIDDSELVIYLKACVDEANKKGNTASLDQIIKNEVKRAIICAQTDLEEILETINT